VAKKGLLVGVAVLVGLFVVIGLLVVSGREAGDVIESGERGPVQQAVDVGKQLVASVAPSNKDVYLGGVAGTHAAYDFTVTIPKDWQVEVVPGIEAVNIYDPKASGVSNLEKSQIFLRHFKASDFLTLSTVTIFEQTSTTINGRATVIYDIEKLPAVANFAQQPSWRSGRHTVTDIRVTATGSSEFIVSGKRPDLSQEVFDAFLQSIEFAGGLGVGLVPPVAGFAKAVKLKPFGIHITPESSPVQPERFTGFHTGADAELPADTPVVAVADGKVVRSGVTSGYGGLLAIEHQLKARRLVSIYGHLDPKSLTSNGAQVVQGEQIGVLGEAKSAQTDGERAHLHFGLSRAVGVDVRGYVTSQSELAAWADPLTLIQKP